MTTMEREERERVERSADDSREEKRKGEAVGKE
jgi:hypothetical protein